MMIYVAPFASGLFLICGSKSFQTFGISGPLTYEWLLTVAFPHVEYLTCQLQGIPFIQATLYCSQICPLADPEC